MRENCQRCRGMGVADYRKNVLEKKCSHLRHTTLWFKLLINCSRGLTANSPSVTTHACGPLCTGGTQQWPWCWGHKMPGTLFSHAINSAIPGTPHEQVQERSLSTPPSTRPGAHQSCARECSGSGRPPHPPYCAAAHHHSPSEGFPAIHQSRETGSPPQWPAWAH